MQELRETAAVSRQDRREGHVLFIPRTECGRVSVVPAAYAVMCFVNVVAAALSISHPVVSPALIHSPQFTQPLFLLPKTEIGLVARLLSRPTAITFLRTQFIAAMPATTAETLSLVSRQVSVAPMVLLSAADHYGRSAKGTRKRVVGVLLGQNDGKSVRVSNSFAGE